MIRSHAHIPEPTPRIAPAPISSGISIRRPPTATFSTLRQTLQHFEQKAAGIPPARHSKSERYLFDLLHELNEISAQLEQRYEVELREKRQRILTLEQTLFEWETVFDKESKSKGKNALPSASLPPNTLEAAESIVRQHLETPFALRSKIRALEQRVSELETENKHLTSVHGSDLESFGKAIEDHHRAARQQLDREAEKAAQEHDDEMTALRRLHAARVESMEQQLREERDVSAKLSESLNRRIFEDKIRERQFKDDLQRISLEAEIQKRQAVQAEKEHVEHMCEERLKQEKSKLQLSQFIAEKEAAELRNTISSLLKDLQKAEEAVSRQESNEMRSDLQGLRLAPHPSSSSSSDQQEPDDMRPRPLHVILSTLAQRENAQLELLRRARERSLLL